MGDKERSMEAEQEQEKETKMVLHCPIYPLPEDIKKMEHDETVCRYCGVSYLIYHEFQQLHTRLAQTEAELKELRGTARRERAQREALELDRLEWERALHLEAHRKAEERERSMREELEEKSRDMERTLTESFEAEHERKRRDNQKITEEKERQLRRELADSEAERLRRLKEELENRAEEREKVLSDALQKANKNLDELRKYLRQLEERLVVAASTEEEGERWLIKEKQQSEILRGVCAQQEKALRSTLSVLRPIGSELTDVRGLLSHLTGAWQAFKSQMLQHTTQVFSVLREEQKHSYEELQNTREDKEHLTQQLMEQRKRSEEQLSQQETEHRGKLLRLKRELEEKHERWLSCRQRWDTAREQLLSWQQREEQMNRKCCTAEEEVTRLREALEKVQQEARELRRERDTLIESHGTALAKMEEDCRQQMASKLSATLEAQRAQSALHLREQMEEVRREVELELAIDRDRNQMLLLKYQQDSAQLQQKLEERERELLGASKELQQERRSREEERRIQDEQRRRREEEMHQEFQRSQQQEALQLSQAKAELQLITESNAELQEEVALLQETVRRECEEREELTAALTKAQERLLRLHSPASHQSPRSPPDPTERQTPWGNKPSHLKSRARLPLTRSSTSPNTLRSPHACTDKDRGQGTDGGGARRSLESWNGGGVLGGETWREGALPRLNASSTSNKVNRRVSLVMGGETVKRDNKSSK